MSEASQRVLAWREQKREEGYQPVTIWILATVKNQMVNDAFQLHRDLGELIAEVYLAHPPTKGGRGPALMDRRQVETLVKEQVTRALASVPLPPPAPVEPVPKKARPTPPAGTKQCLKGHEPYPATKRECPRCVQAYQRAKRERDAAKRRGVVPASPEKGDDHAAL